VDSLKPIQLHRMEACESEANALSRRAHPTAENGFMKDDQPLDCLKCPAHCCKMAGYVEVSKEDYRAWHISWTCRLARLKLNISSTPHGPVRSESKQCSVSINLRRQVWGEELVTWRKDTKLAFFSDSVSREAALPMISRALAGRWLTVL
jgi:hypothetical protein